MKRFFIVFFAIILSNSVLYADEFLFAGEYYEGTYLIDSSTLQKHGDVLFFGCKVIPSQREKQFIFNLAISGDIEVDLATKLLSYAWGFEFYAYNIKTKEFRNISKVQYNNYGDIIYLVNYRDKEIFKTFYEFHPMPESSCLVKIVSVILSYYSKYVINN